MSKPNSIWEVKLGRPIETTAPHSALVGGDGRVYAIGSKGAFATGGPLLQGVQVKTVPNQTGSLSADQVVGGLISFTENLGAAATITLPSPAELKRYLTDELFLSSLDARREFAGLNPSFATPAGTTTGFDCTFITTSGTPPILAWNSNSFFPTGLGGGTELTTQLEAQSSYVFRFLNSNATDDQTTVVVLLLGRREVGGVPNQIQSWAETLAEGEVSGPRNPKISTGQQIVFEEGIRMGGGNVLAGAVASRSVGIGNGATAPLQDSVALGNAAQATGLESVAAGNNAQATGGQSSAIGPTTQATGLRSTAIGYEADATAEDSTAIGYVARALHARSTAVGTLALTTAADQVRLGTANHTVSVPGKFQMDPLDDDLDLNLPTFPTLPGPPNSAPPDGTLMIDTASNLLNFRAGGSWIPLPSAGGGGTQNLNQVLTVGNTTDGQDIVVNGTDKLYLPHNLIFRSSPTGLSLSVADVLQSSLYFRADHGPGQTDTLPPFLSFLGQMPSNEERIFVYWNSGVNAITLNAGGGGNVIFLPGQALGSASIVVPANSTGVFRVVEKGFMAYYGLSLTGGLFGAGIQGWPATLASNRTCGTFDPLISSGQRLAFESYIDLAVDTLSNTFFTPGSSTINVGSLNTNRNSITVGNSNLVNRSGSVVVGYGNFVEGSATNALVVGTACRADYANSGAIGNNAVADAANELRVGGATQYVRSPFIHTDRQEHFVASGPTTDLLLVTDYQTVSWPTTVSSDSYDGWDWRRTTTSQVFLRPDSAFFVTCQITADTDTTQTYGEHYIMVQLLFRHETTTELLAEAIYNISYSDNDTHVNFGQIVVTDGALNSQVYVDARIETNGGTLNRFVIKPVSRLSVMRIM